MARSLPLLLCIDIYATEPRALMREGDPAEICFTMLYPVPLCSDPRSREERLSNAGYMSTYNYVSHIFADITSPP
jgi:hypothetical protein